MSEAREFRQHRFVPPPGATELLLVRHGESAPAVEGELFPLVDGHGDPPLSDEGRKQARRVCARLAHEHIDAVYVTPLRRTRETAQPLLERLGIEPRVERDLREVYLGEWEGGVFRQKVSEGDPIARKMVELQRWDVIPGAESSEALATRVRAAVERLAAAHPDQRVAVFAHGGTIGEICALATKSEPWAFVGADNASITRVVVTAKRWILRRFNDTGHLDGSLCIRPAPWE
ncbi:MAG: histidine phosphatase family protein [Acidimicrobiales bacterium]|nr:histidine phosphatase family protein [Acidimicrobiales bacterium]